MAQNLTISGQFSPTVDNVIQTTISGILAIATPVCATTRVALANGLNTITIPTGTTFVFVQLPAGNVQTVTLKGVTGDTGIPILKTGLIGFTPDPADTTFALTAGGAIAAFTTIIFV